MINKSKTVCAAFWNIASIRNNSDVHPCCRFKYPVLKLSDNLNDILTSTQYQSLRDNSLLGNEIEGCQKCYQEEKLGKTSLRQQYNNEFSTDEIKLQFVDIAFDNICNLTCDGCWDEFSNSWGEKLNPGKHKKFYLRQIKEIKEIPNSVKKIWFLGGEPLMTSRHKKLLQKIKNLQNIDVIYNTNGSFLLDNETIQLLEKCQSVTINLSIDGLGELNERVRSGSNWNKTIEFIDQIKELSCCLNIHTVVHKNNWFGLNDLENFVKVNNFSWTINVLTFPKELQIKNLDQADKEKFKNYLTMSSIPDKGYILEFLYEA